MSFCGTSVLFVLKPPYTEEGREQFYTWLCEHTSMEKEECRQIAITGELTPVLLSVAKTSGQTAEWADQLEAMDVPVYRQSFAPTDRPLEAVFVSGRIPGASRTVEFFKSWNESYPDNQILRSDASKLMHGVDVMCLGTFEVHDTRRDRDPITLMVESYGLSVLGWFDIQNPWVD